MSSASEVGVEVKPVDLDKVRSTDLARLRTSKDELARKGVSVRAINQEIGDLDRRKRLFVFLCILQLVLNFDSGIVPSSLTAIKEEYDLTNTEAGALGSLVYIGLVFSCPITGYLLSTWKSQRKVLLLSLGLNMGALICFVVAPSKPLLFVARFLTGLSQAPLFVYPPVWVDEFAPEDSLTTWVSSLQGMAPLGVMLGYVISFSLSPSFGAKWGWRATVILQCILMVPYFVMYLTIPGRYFNAVGGELARLVDQHNKMQKKEQRKSSEELIGDAPRSDDEIAPDKEEANSAALSNSKYDNSLTMWQQLRMLVGSALYMWLVFALSGLYFVVTGIQFWVTDYMVEVIKTPLVQVQTGFAVTSITGPLIGVIFGGWLIDKLGGYKDDSGASGVVALRACLFLGLGAVICSLVAAAWTEFWPTLISIWLVLFFGGAILPALTGLIINAVGEECRNMASSFSMFMFNIFGYGMAPVLSGAIGDATGSMVWGFRSIMYMACASICCSVGAYFAMVQKVKNHEMESKTRNIRRNSCMRSSVRTTSTDRRRRTKSHGVSGQHNAVENMSIIARGVNSRGSVSPNFFGLLDNLHEHEERNSAKNFTVELGTLSELEEVDEEGRISTDI